MNSEDWPEVRLGDLGRIVTGKTPSTKVADYFGGVTPFVTPSDMDGRRIIGSTERYLTERGVESVRNALVREGSVMVSCIGSDMGKAAIAGRECVTNQQINSIVVDPAHCAEYIYYNLSARKSELQALAASGSAQPILNKGHFSQVTLPLPPLAEQKRIAKVLGALDDKIELNRRMNRTLESIARAIFKSWFVDFDPVRKKMEGKTGGELGLPPSLAALFPNRLQESALGPVPLGWGVKACASEFGVTMGQSPPGDTYNEVGEGLPFFQGRRDFGSRYPTRRVFCTSPKRFASPGDALVSVRAPVGDVNMATERCCIGRGVAAVRHRSGAVTYTYEMMRSLRDDFADFEAGGTVFGSISSKDFANLLVIAPPVDLVSSYEHMLEPVERAIRNLHESAKVMTALRDALLPRLLQHGGLKMAAAHGGLTAFVNPSEARA